MSPDDWDWDDDGDEDLDLDDALDGDWDAGLAAAFGESDVREESESVLDRVESRVGKEVRVHLEGPAAPASPVVRLHNDASRVEGLSDRYQMLGEIARGGVGIVLKGRDKDLGRDLAMKVLRPDHADDPGLIQRFVEEAQIAGQLQHPGIVPVYELGLDGDGRPFFTMKLIEGRTLSAVLRERADPSDDLPRFLRIFEQVCDAVAYAHARRVVHRDLKPANVMVGAYGEVLVADWGFAKVLGQGGVADELSSRREVAERASVQTVRSGPDGEESQVGSVLGTPAYMPPEQARGMVEQLDERSDVFALGAILCEILTGAPPYVGESARDLVVMAAGAKLDEARSRLQGSGADEPLVDLALRCLAPERAARPADAAVVAVELERYLESLSERARSAEVAAAEARVRAREERKARRLTLGLAASVLVAIGLGVGGWAWIDAQEEQRLADVRRRNQEATLDVEERLQAAARLIGEERWSEALAQIERAEQRAADGEVPAEFIGRAAELASEARTRIRQAALFERLERLRTFAEHDLLDPDASYAEAFSEFGVDVLRTSADEVVERLDLRPVDELEAALALDDWARRRLHPPPSSGVSEPKPADHLVDIAKRLDPDPWRGRLRDAALAGELDRLQALAQELDWEAVVVESVELLGISLGAGGDASGALALYRRGVQEFPGDYLLRLHLTIQLLQSEERTHEELALHAEAATALRPDDPAARQLLMRSLALDGRKAEARREYELTLERFPDSEELERFGAILRAELGEREAVVAELREMLADSSSSPRDRRALDYLERGMRRGGRFAGGPRATLEPGETAPAAVTRLEREVAARPDDRTAWAGLAQARLLAGDPRGAIEAATRHESDGRRDRHVNATQYLALMDLGEFVEAAELAGRVLGDGLRDRALLAARVARSLDLHAGGQAVPDDTDELLALAGAAFAAERYETASDWFSQATASDAWMVADALQAAVSHVLAARRSDDDAAAAEYRERSLALLEGLDWRDRRASLDLRVLGRVVRVRLLHDPRLESVRGAERLDELPVDEAVRWREAWTRLRRQSVRR